MMPSLLLLEKQKFAFEVRMCWYLNTVCIACLDRQDTLLCVAPVVGDYCALKAVPEGTLFFPSLCNWVCASLATVLEAILVDAQEVTGIALGDGLPPVLR